MQCAGEESGGIERQVELGVGRDAPGGLQQREGEADRPDDPDTPARQPMVGGDRGQLRAPVSRVP